MKNWIVVLAFSLCCLYPAVLEAQVPVQNLRGTVTDEDTKAPLPGAKVMITDLNPVRGVLSDENGNFSFTEVPVGRHTLLITYLGYEDRSMKELTLTSGKEMVLNIGLREAYIQAEEVKITAVQAKDQAVNELAAVSARSFSVEETQRYAASLNDPGRMASAFAGVQPSSDGRNNIVIRGNSPAGMLWRLEGVDIPNPNHFASPGSSGGGLSILSNYLLSNSDFMTGAFPAEYGNAVSGVFDLRLRKGNNERHEFGIQAGFLGMQAAAEGPLSKKSGASYIVNYRYSTLGLMQKFGLPIVQDATYSYQDLNFNLSFPTAKAGTFTFFGLGGLSSQTAKADRDSTKWQVRSDRRDEKFGSDMGASGITHTYLFGSGKTWLRSALSLSSNHIYGTEDSLDNQYNKTSLGTDGFLTGKASFTSTLNHKIDARHLIRTGLFVDYLFYSLKSSYLDFSNGQMKTALDTKGGAWLVQPYFHYRWRLNEKLTWNAGLHSMLFLLNQSASLEPRTTLNWSYGKKLSLSFGYGLHSQVLPLGTYFSEIRLADSSLVKPNHDLRLMKAHHFVLGHDILFNPNLRLKTEVYFQYLFNVPIGTATHPTLSVLNTNWGFETDSLLNKGKGYNYGIEFTFEKFFSNQFYFLLTTSLYQSKYKAWDDSLRNTRFNGNYAFNLLGGKEIWLNKQHTKYLEMSGRVVWQGGQRFTPIDLAASLLAGRTVYDESQTLKLRKKDYFRTDIRVAMHIDGKKASHTFSFDVQNLFNTKNDFVQDYDPDTGGIKQYYQAGFVPVFAYRADF